MRKKEFIIQLIILILGMITYSLLAFAYMHDNFSSKDLIKMMIERQDRVELKIDHLIERSSL